MAAQSFRNILRSIENSKLNYQMQLSPFSAVISLKKSYIKDKMGNVLVPSNDMDATQDYAA